MLVPLWPMPKEGAAGTVGGEEWAGGESDTGEDAEMGAIEVAFICGTDAESEAIEVGHICESVLDVEELIPPLGPGPEPGAAGAVVWSGLEAEIVWPVFLSTTMVLGGAKRVSVSIGDPEVSTT